VRRRLKKTVREGAGHAGLSHHWGKGRKVYPEIIPVKREGCVRGENESITTGQRESGEQSSKD